MLYVARDKDGDLWLFTSKPVRVRKQSKINGLVVEYWKRPSSPDNDDYTYGVLGINPNLFPNLKWEDEPIAVELVEYYPPQKS